MTGRAATRRARPLTSRQLGASQVVTADVRARHGEELSRSNTARMVSIESIAGVLGEPAQAFLLVRR